MDASITRSRLSPLLIASGIFTFYFIMAKLGLQMALVHPSATAIWAPTGIALATFLIFGKKFWPAIFSAAFLVNYLTAGNLLTTFVIASGNTLEGLLGAMLVQQFANGRKVFEKASDILKFIVMAELISTLISPTVGVTILCVEGFAHWNLYWDVWFTWWLGDLSGALLVTPVLVLWYDNPRVNLRQLPVTIGSFLVLGLIGQAVFGNWLFPGKDMDAEFLCIPPLLWIAYRFDRKETATASLILCVIAIWNTVHGVGPFTLPSKDQSLILLQVFMSVISISSLALAAAISERKTAEEHLERAQKAEKKLQDKIDQIQLLQSITAAANESITLPEAVQLSLKLICRYMGWPVGHVYYVDQNDEHLLKPGAQWFVKDEQKYKNLRQVTDRYIFRPGEGLPGTVYASGSPMWIEDVVQFKNFPRIRMGQDIKVRAAFGFPIMIGKKIVAVLEFFTDRTVPPDKELMESMKTVGTQLGRIIERHNAEQAQNQLALLVETSSDFIVTTNSEGYILYLNEAGRAMVGLDKNTNVNVLRHEDFVFPNDILKLRGEVLDTLVTRGHWEGEFNLKNFKTGKPVPIYFSAGLLKDPQTGLPATLAAIGHDVTDIKKAEEALHHSEKHYRALIENALDIVTILNEEGRYTYLSPSIFNVLGYSPEELMGTNAFALIHPDDVEQVVNKFNAALAVPEQPQSVQFRFKLKDGSWKPLEAIGKNLLSDPSVKGIVVNSRDLTDKRAAEKELASTNSFLSTVLENIPNMIFVKDAKDLRFVMFNKAGEELIGVSRENLINKNDYDFFPKEQADFFTTNDRKVIAERKLLDIAEENIQTQDKGNRILHTKKIPVFNDDGTPRFLMGISEDITTAKLTQKSLRESEEKFKLLLDNVQDYAIVLLDEHGIVVTWNEGAERLKGYEASEIIGKSFSCFYTAEDIKKDHHHQLLETAKTKGHSNDIGWRARKDGSLFWADVIITALRDDQGRLTGFAKVTRNISDQRNAELALQKQAQLLQSIIDNMGEGLLVCDSKGKTLFVNPAANQMLGGQIGDPIPNGSKLKNEVYWADNQTPIEPQDFPISRSLQGESSDNVELYIKNKQKPDGVYILATSRPIRDSDGKISGAVSVFRDITDQKKIEEEQQRLVTLVEHSRDMIVWSTPEGENLYINAAGREMIGVDPNMDAAKINLKTFAPSDGKDQVKSLRKNQSAALQQRGFWEGELNIPHQKTGKLIPIHFSIVMLKNPKTGKPIGTATIGRDITERQEAEKTLRESDTRFRSVVQSSTNAIVIADGNGNILSWNNGAQNTFGYAEKEIINQPFTRLLPSKFQEAYTINETKLQNQQNSKLFGKTIELQGIRKNGSEFPIELSLSTWKIDDDTYFGGIIRDITERKKMEDLLRSNTELQQFANVASHDLQEPLRMVASYVQLLSEHLKGKLDEDSTEYMGFAVDGAKRMQMLVNGLLEYSRVESRGKELQDVDMNQVFNQTISNLEIRINETHAKINHGPLPHVLGDPVQLAQLIQNLFSNGLKFQKSEFPEIDFSASENENEWVFACKDNGIGIDPKYYDRIFVIFQRLHHRDEYSGTGIGLAVCKRIVERHGGKIWVESKPDSGATFYFTLPKRNGQ